MTKTHLKTELNKLAFHQAEKLDFAVDQIYDFIESPAFAHVAPQLDILCHWFTIPYSFWPIDFRGAALHTCSHLRTSRFLEPEMVALLDDLQNYPPKDAQEIVNAAEHAVQEGQYDRFLTARGRAKFEAKDRETKNNPVLQHRWKSIKKTYPVAEFANKRGVIMRRLVLERNFRPKEWLFKYASVYDRFLNRFDAFCHQFDLYGMENDVPLLLKPSVTVIPFGTMVIYPKYWSLDAGRDIERKELVKLHKAHQPERQGETFTEIKMDYHTKIKRVLAANRKALADGLEGQDRFNQIIREIGLTDKTDHCYIRRLIKVGQKMEAEGKL